VARHDPQAVAYDPACRGTPHLRSVQKERLGLTRWMKRHRPVGQDHDLSWSAYPLAAPGSLLLLSLCNPNHAGRSDRYPKSCKRRSQGAPHPTSSRWSRLAIDVRLPLETLLSLGVAAESRSYTSCSPVRPPPPGAE